MPDSHQLRLFPEPARRPSLRGVADLVRVGGVEALADARLRADHVRYQEIDVRSALTRAQGMPFRWALNPYRGCTHGCHYCYARKYQRHLELDAGDAFSSLILVKVNLPECLERELRRPAWGHETIAVGTATDPYQPIEGRYELTRRALEVCRRLDTPVSIVTKGPMIVRDIDVLQALTRRVRVSVYLSIPSVDEEAWARLEPGTASPAQRLRAVGQLTEAGIRAGVLMMPLVPGVTTSRSSVRRTLEAVAASGARFAGTCVARLDAGVREHFLSFLAREYPHLVAGYERLYRGARPAPGYVREIDAMVEVLRTRGPAGA
jgi:DNA repair photolyase